MIFQKEAAWDEKQTEVKVKKQMMDMNVEVLDHWSSTLLPLIDVANMPDVFSVWRKQVEEEKPLPVKIPLATPVKESFKLPTNWDAGLPSLPTIQELHVDQDEQQVIADQRTELMKFSGGETAGLARIQEYIFDKDCLRYYFET